mmetsp:Transcript_22606/g.40458  ORF Transcript_22606/g.40458 Transcript_22606/m.40458 type:complete len:205 (-) Transcript_22606:381-995(-)|eukprot:CAMPEP_0201888238 /NCGR_PEP_ID=MMETSP0902-20130614/27077_1 /ASSEMBLY_ACC=CAM_ASM_000551 /TAXON_ID=420261 /ORGANISM="Thalassiosira antarctica, Strain CCMP982" /LENGTH=204 /DNA_ID=CAMNT_0048418437 /DNA_START=66 /DNA_END=680 /DNA_ORIENTATION=-
MTATSLLALSYHEDWKAIRTYLSSNDATPAAKEAALTEQGPNGMTCLHYACGYNGAPSDIVEAMVDMGGKYLVTMKTDNGITALHYAYKYTSTLEVVSLLVRIGGKDLVTIKDNSGRTALHDLCLNIHSHSYPAGSIQLLIDVGGQDLLVAEDDNGNTALDFATCASQAVKGLLTPSSQPEPEPTAIPLEINTPSTTPEGSKQQ